MTENVHQLKNANSIELNKPIDYLIFSRVDVQIEWESGGARKAVIIDRKDNSVLIELEPGIEIKRDEKGTMICPYRGKRLVFDILVQSVDNAQLYICEKPKFGYLVNERNKTRSKFENAYTKLKAQIDAETLAGDITFSSARLIDFSWNTISLVLDRDEGILLPNDYIKKITITNADENVIEGSGVVIRSEHQDGTVLAVIEVLELNKRPEIDIHKNERRSERISMRSRDDAFIEFVHPFVGQKVSAYVHDLSNSGMAIILEANQPVLLQGMLIADASLQLPLRPRIPVTLKIRKITETIKENKLHTRVSIEFYDMTATLDKELTAFVQKSVSENLSYIKSEEYDELWEFYFDTGFIYEDKRRQIQRYSELIKATQKKLILSESPVLKKVVYRSDDKIVANGNALKAFDNTLLLQHLQSLKSNSGEGAKNIIRGMTTFFLDLKTNRKVGNRYVCTYYRPDNLFPSLVFGDVATLIDDPDKCWCTEYQFCLKANIPTNFEQNEKIQCRWANDADKGALEELIINAGDIQWLKLESLNRENITNLAVTNEFVDIGLYRYRRLFVAENTEDGSIGYAICTYSSPGMNLSELTNSVKFVFNTNEIAKQKILVNQMIKPILDSYETTEMNDPVLLVKPNQAIPDGFTSEKKYLMWALDLTYIKLFKDNSEHVFANLREFIKKKRALSHS